MLGILLVTSGCSGSQLGDKLGKRLEPDPQLIEAEERANEQAAKEAAESTVIADTTATREAENSSDQSAESEPPAARGEQGVGGYTDLGNAPEELQPALKDLIALDLLEVRSPAAPASTNSGSTGNASGNTTGSTAPAKPPTPAPAPPRADEFRPNQAITRREYARWLLATNNRFYSGQQNRRIRAGVNSSQPVFQDVKANDPDFGAIQGLAEAGIIPSSLTGSSTAITFRPDAPLTRKDLVLWKVPLDTRQPLPQATPAAVQEAWGFQDAGKIEPRALQAVLADYQNGDQANIRRALGYTTLFQPDKAVTRAEAASVLWRFGNSTEGITAAELRAPQADDSADETGTPDVTQSSQ